MENELFNIFNDDKEPIGVATRAEVHRQGYWHEVFHCWIVAEEAGSDYIYLQLRSEQKKDYPGLLDITAAGHLLAHETVQDGVREMAEEIGVRATIDELTALGVIDYQVEKDSFIDKEIAHVFLYRQQVAFADFTLQVEEVAGIVKARFSDFMALWQGEKTLIPVSGFKLNDNGQRIAFDEQVGREAFVDHPASYYDQVIQRLKNVLPTIC